VKPLSPRAEQLIAILWREPSLADRLLGRSTLNVDALVELERLDEPAVVPHLLDYVFGNTPSVARATAAVLDRAITAASPDELLELDLVCREWWPVFPPTVGWRTLRPVDLSRFSAFGDLEVAVVGVASFHGNGYVREAAVTRLASLAGGRELPFLLVRLNDWVTQVAEAARIAVERRLTSAYASAFFDNLPILLRLGLSRRREHDAVLDRIYALLRAPEHREVLARWLEAPQRGVRRATFRLAREAPHADRLGLLRQALRDSDTLIRLEAVADARRRLSGDALQSMLPAILADPHPSIRGEGITAAAERLGDDAEKWLTAGLLDPSKSVREIARFFLRRSGLRSDFAAYYRERLHDPDVQRLASAIAGLGETGGASDVHLVLPFLEHERPKVRRPALRALSSLDPEATLPRIVEMLHDPAPSVSHAARQTLRRRRVDPAAVTSVFRTAAHSHSRFDALALGTTLSKWDSLPLLLEAATDDDPRLRTAARTWLKAWVAKQNRSFAQPTAAQIDGVRAALEAHRFAIEPVVTTELWSVVRYWAGPSARGARH